MSKTGITRLTVKTGEPLPKGATDWQRLDAMTDEEVIAAALADPDAQPSTSGKLASMRRVSRVKVLRQRLGMNQAEFAHTFHLPVITLREFEQRRADARRRRKLRAIGLANTIERAAAGGFEAAEIRFTSRCPPPRAPVGARYATLDDEAAIVCRVSLLLGHQRRDRVDFRARCLA